MMITRSTKAGWYSLNTSVQMYDSEMELTGCFRGKRTTARTVNNYSPHYWCMIKIKSYSASSSSSSSSLSCPIGSSPSKFWNSPVSEFHKHLMCTLNSAISKAKSFCGKEEEGAGLKSQVTRVTVLMSSSGTDKDSPGCEPAPESVCRRLCRPDSLVVESPHLGSENQNLCHFEAMCE